MEVCGDGGKTSVWAVKASEEEENLTDEKCWDCVRWNRNDYVWEMNSIVSGIIRIPNESNVLKFITLPTFILNTEHMSFIINI
jgi:hypothetical protein